MCDIRYSVHMNELFTIGGGRAKRIKTASKREKKSKSFAHEVPSSETRLNG